MAIEMPGRRVVDYGDCDGDCGDACSSIRALNRVWIRAVAGEKKANE